jgi:hypothetical protein
LTEGEQLDALARKDFENAIQLLKQKNPVWKTHWVFKICDLVVSVHV